MSTPCETEAKKKLERFSDKAASEVDPGDARERLRAAARDTKKYPELAKSHKPRTPWRWVKGSDGAKEARIALK